MNKYLKITPVALVLGTLAAGTAAFAITSHPKHVAHHYGVIVSGHVASHYAVVKAAGHEQGKSESKSKKEDNEADESNLTAALTPAQAVSAALAAYPGGIATGKPELEDENGTAVYGVEVKTADGKKLDVKVDANSGSILKADSDEDDKSEGGEADND